MAEAPAASQESLQLWIELPFPDPANAPAKAAYTPTDEAASQRPDFELRVSHPCASEGEHSLQAVQPPSLQRFPICASDCAWGSVGGFELHGGNPILEHSWAPFQAQSSDEKTSAATSSPKIQKTLNLKPQSTLNPNDPDPKAATLGSETP